MQSMSGHDAQTTDNQTAHQPAGGGQTGTCLFESDGLRLQYRAGSSAHALVVFGDGTPMGASSGVWRLVGSGTRTGAVEVFEIQPRRASIFPADEMEALCGVISGANTRPAIALGSAEGGHAALRYGRPAGCAVALAFSPSGAEPADQAGLAPLALVACDPEREADALQGEALRLLDGVQMVPLPYMGLRTERALSGAAVSREVFGAALKGDTETVARLLRHNRRQDESFLSALSRACSAAGHARWGADIAAMGQKNRQHLPPLAMARAEAQAGLGRPMAAVETLEGLVVAAPQSPRYWTLLIDRYEAMGQDAAVAELLELALAQTENFSFCWRLIRKLSEMDAQARAQARALAGMALEHWPERRGQIDRVLKALPGT